MAHYETSVTTTHSSTEAFAMMADMARFVEWDPGVQSASQTTGTVPGIGAAYRLVVNGVGPAPATPLTYVMEEFEDGKRFRAVAKAKFFASDDIVTVTPAGTGCIVKYEADLLLSGPFKLFDPLLGPVFNKIGDAAAKGLQKFLA